MPKTENGTSARRALRVLKALKGHSVTGLSNKEIADTLGETPVNVSRALAALEEEGLAAKLETGRWAHTVAMLQIAEAHTRCLASATDRISELRQRVAAGAHG